jgi:hypothetical protein
MIFQGTKYSPKLLHLSIKCQGVGASKSQHHVPHLNPLGLLLHCSRPVEDHLGWPSTQGFHGGSARCKQRSIPDVSRLPFPSSHILNITCPQSRQRAQSCFQCARLLAHERVKLTTLDSTRNPSDEM